MRHSVFKSKAGRDKIRSFYNDLLDRFPVETQYVETRIGRTFVVTAGKESAPPVLLLHGSCCNSAFWIPEIMALSSRYRVYAVDIVGEAGNSEEYRPDLLSDAFSLWMKDLLDALALEKAVFLGNSLGGWMALKFATAFPERVSRLILIASAGLAEVRPQFLQHAEETLRKAGPVSVDPSILGPQEIPKEILDFITLIVENYEPIRSLPLFSDAQLRRLTMPVLFLGGEEDALVDTAESAKRLTRLVPSAEVRLLPLVGHLITDCLERIGESRTPL